MPAEPAGVAKLIVRIENTGTPTVLLSRKRAKGTPKHGRLELLGGGIDDGEDPLEGLMRELAEEEKTGGLARKVGWEQPAPKLMTIEGTPHYIFEVSISLEEYLELQHNRKESLGLKVVPESVLSNSQFQSRLTPKMQKILAMLREKG